MKLIYAFVLVVVFIGGFFALNAYRYDEKQATSVLDYKDAEYVIAGERVKLTDGSAEKEAAPGSASKITTRYFGNDVLLDLDGDGRNDVVFLVTQETGGTGTFFYVVAALNTSRGYVGSEALYLGDRIAPQTTEVSAHPSHNNVIIVNYADRAEGEDFSLPPSVGKSIWLKLDIASMQFGEVAQHFEGEADPATMTLSIKSWHWTSSLYNDGREIVPKKADEFTIAFGKDGRFSASTDCNSISGAYVADDGMLTFNSIASTKKYCEGSQEADFIDILEGASAYHFTSRGELIINLKFDSGAATFK